MSLKDKLNKYRKYLIMFFIYSIFIGIMGYHYRGMIGPILGAILFVVTIIVLLFLPES